MEAEKTNTMNKIAMQGLTMIPEPLYNVRDKRTYFEKLIDFNNSKVPILKGCPNEQCFCSGACKEIVGYRDRLPSEKK